MIIRELRFTHFDGFPRVYRIEYLRCNGCFTVTDHGIIVHRGRGYFAMRTYCDKIANIYAKRDCGVYSYDLITL